MNRKSYVFFVFIALFLSVTSTASAAKGQQPVRNNHTSASTVRQPTKALSSTSSTPAADQNQQHPAGLKKDELSKAEKVADIIAGIQAVIFILQAGIFYFQLTAFKKQAGFMGITVNEMREAYKLANAEFISNHRPKIIVRHLLMNRTGNNYKGKIKIDISFFNAGDGKATITDWSGKIMHGKKFGPIRLHDMPKMVTYKSILESGTGIGLEIEDSYDFPNGINEANIFCFGTVSYKDDLGTTRNTWFLRRYNPNTERFEIQDDPDYEYAY